MLGVERSVSTLSRQHLQGELRHTYGTDWRTWPAAARLYKKIKEESRAGVVVWGSLDLGGTILTLRVGVVCTVVSPTATNGKSTAYYGNAHGVTHGNTHGITHGNTDDSPHSRDHDEPHRKPRQGPRKIPRQGPLGTGGQVGLRRHLLNIDNISCTSWVAPRCKV